MNEMIEKLTSNGLQIAMIAALDKNRVIGSDNAMPWHLPDDLKFFKDNTLKKTVVMGRKTFESIGARPLPNRRNLVITRNTDFQAPGIEVFTSIDAALQSCVTDTDEVIIMGGGQLYQQMMPYAHKLYLTLVEAEVSGDTVFPEWSLGDWQITSEYHHPQDEKHAYAFEFVILERTSQANHFESL